MKTNYTALTLAIFALFSLSIISCKKEVFDTTPPPIVNPPGSGGDSSVVIDPCDTLDYKNDTKIIFDTKCATSGCHDGSTTLNDYRDLKNIQSDKDKIIKRVFEIGDMPPSGNPQLTDFEKSTMKKWLECGAIGEAVVVEKKVSFSNEVKPIVDARCISCHAPGGSGIAKGDYTKFADFKAYSVSGAITTQAIDNSFMPQGGPALSQAEKDLIKKWIDEGSNNN